MSTSSSDKHYLEIDRAVPIRLIETAISSSLRSSARSASFPVTVCKYKRAARSPLLFVPVYSERRTVCAFVCIVSTMLSVPRKETRVSGFINTSRSARAIMKCLDGIILLPCKWRRASASARPVATICRPPFAWHSALLSRSQARKNERHAEFRTDDRTINKIALSFLSWFTSIIIPDFCRAPRGFRNIAHRVLSRSIYT